MRLFCLSCLFAFAVAPAVAQTGVASDPDPFLLVMQGFRTGGVGGAGLSSAFGVGVADLGGANPVALAAFDRAAAGLTYQFETPIDGGYFAGIGYGPMNGPRPQSAGFVVPLGAWAVGASYAQRYAAVMDFAPIPLQTPAEPELDFDLAFDLKWISRVETLGPQVAYRRALAGGGEVAFGARVGIGYGRFEQEFEAEDGSGAVEFGFSEYQSFSDWGANVAVGASYREAGLGLAAHYESALRFEGHRDLIFLFPTGPGDLGDPTTLSLPIADAIPARLAFSAEVAASPTLELGADFARVFWKDAWAESDQLKNQNEAAAWARFDLSGEALAHVGLWYQGRSRWGSDIENALDYGGRSVYLTVGGVLTFDRIRLDAVVADSRLLSAEEQRQTLLKVGASVTI